MFKKSSFFTDNESTRDFYHRFFLNNGQNINPFCFTQISEVKGNRIQNDQISMIHIRSGIKCLLLFENESSFVQSSEIIARYVNMPICE